MTNVIDATLIMGIGHKVEDKYRTEDVKLNLDHTFDFSRLLIAPKVLDGLMKAGFLLPSPIQVEAIPLGRCGFDLVIQAKSGTGKTCVFAVIALENVDTDNYSTQVLALAPTREVALQIMNVVSTIGCEIPNLKCHAFIGGLSVVNDKAKAKNCQVAIGTPGRIKQLMAEGVLKCHSVRLFVLDEVDKLLDESFQRDINWIFHKLPLSKQVLALSATYPEELASLLTKYMQSPAFVRLNSTNPALIGVKQFYQITRFHPLQTRNFENKFPSILNVLSSITFGQCIIFSNYHTRAQNLCDKLNANGWPTVYICGQKSQAERLQAVEYMKNFTCRILVSTDLLARGIDLENVNLVFNVDVPQDIETYLHRIGRAGRFGSLAIAITFASDGEERNLLSSFKAKGKLSISELPEQLNNEIWNFEVTESKYSVTSPFQPHPQGLRSTEDRQKSDVSIGSIDTKKIGAVMIEDLKRANYINIGVVSKPNDALSAEELCQTDTDELQLSLPDSKVNRLNDSKMKINQTDILKVLLGDSIVRDVEFYVPEKDVKNDLKAFLKNSESNGSCIACDEVKMTCSLESINPDIEQHNETSLYIVVDDLLSLVHKKFISHQLETNCDKSLSDTFSSFLHECAMVLPLRHQEPCEWSSVEKAFSSELSPSLRSFNVSCALEESVLLQHDFKEVMNIREQSHPLLNIYPNTEKATLATGSIDSNFEMINRHSPRSEEPFFSVSCDCLNDFLPLPLTPKLENMESSMEHLKTLWPQWQKYVRGMKYQIWLTEYIKEMFECSVKCFKNKKSRSSRRS